MTVLRIKRGYYMKVKDGIIGLVIGDALGVPVEFNYRESLKIDPVTKMEGYGTYNMPPGTWSDDSSMTIATMASIVNKNEIDYDDIMKEFLEWIENGKYTQYQDTFDYGITTLHGIMNYKQGIDAIKCGGTGERDNGNGSLMRILPLAFIPDIDYETIENISGLTHGHLRSKIACVFYIEIAKSMLENELSIAEHVKLAENKIKEHYKDSNELSHFSRIFNNDLNNEDTISSKGYVISTFESVIYALETTDNFKYKML